MEWQTFQLVDHVREHTENLRREAAADQRASLASDYQVASATIFPPRGAAGDWRERIVRVLDRRLHDPVSA